MAEIIARAADLTPRNRAAPRGEQIRPRIVSVEDAARYASVSRAQFYAFFMRRVRSVKIGRRRGIELSSLDEVLDELSAAG
jgi:predicted HTH domain antitoxin